MPDVPGPARDEKPEIVAIDGERVTIRIMGETRAEDQPRGMALKLMGRATFDQQKGRFSEFELVASGTPEEVLTPGVLLPTFGQAIVVAPHPTHGVPLVSVAPNGHARHVP